MKKSVFLFIFICIALTGASYAYPKQEVSTKKTQKTKTVKPTFAFIFDDGLTSDVNVFNKFNEYGFKCGFAIITGKLEKSLIAEYLEYQKQGFEILSHSVTHPFFQGVKSVTPETAEAEF